MNELWRESLWQQFGAAIDTLALNLAACPDALWREQVWNDPYAECWNVVFHVLFWTDLYLSGSEEGFAPPAPFTLDELDPSGRLPERPFTRNELEGYVAYVREKCRSTILALSDERAADLCKLGPREFRFVELLLYTLRHVQDHAGQLGLWLGQHGVPSPGWVGRVDRN
jgi:uncharacterized damage-inducible protein DinB